MAKASSNKQRLFFALWPSEAVSAQIARAADRVLAGQSSNPVPECNYHITLAFLGGVSTGSLSDIVAVCRDIRFGRFAVSLDRTGYWPRSRIAWLGPSMYALGLPTLVDDLWNKLADLGLRREELSYRPHVTLARNCSGGLGLQLDDPVDWLASEFVLVQAEPGADSSVYTVLEHFPAGN